MTVSSIKVKVVRKAIVKLKVLPRFPANVVASNFVTLTRSGGTYTLGADYSVLTPGPISDPTTAFLAISDTTSGIYRTVSLASLLTSGVDADLQAIAALTGSGILVRTGPNTWALRTLTGTANRITVTNGDGVAGTPTVDISATYAGQTTITTLGTIATGIWQATKINLAYGGTNADLSATGGAGQYLKQVTAGAAVTVGTIPASDIASGTALTRTNDTNVTLTLGGSPTAALLAATSVTVGWTGTLGASRGGFGADVSAQSGVPLFAAGVPTFTATTGSGNLVRATSPTLVTPALGTPSAVVLTNATGLPLTGLVNQAAYTFAGNNSASPAAPTAVDIGALTLKASPAGTDEIMIRDNAASGAWKRSPISAVGSAGSVASVNGAAGAIITDLHALQNASLAVSASAGALTVALNDASGSTPSAGSAVAVNFRSATATTGSYSTLSVTGATTLTLPSSSTLGILSTTACRIWIVLFNDAGTARLGAINCFDRSAVSFTGLNEGLASSTAVSAAATAAKTFYTGTAVSSKPYRILGYIEWAATGMTAGTWTTTNLLLVQSYGAGCYKPGDVIKTERGTTSTQFNTTSSTYQTTNLTAAISPTSAANMVSAAYMGTLYNRSQAGESCFASIFRGSTQIGPESEGYARNNDMIVISSGLTDDAPNTTASTTYSVKIRNAAGTANMGFPDGGRLSEIRLTEVMT